MTDALAPCPFCGGVQTLGRWQEGEVHFVFCHECETRGPLGVTDGESRRLWNRRTQPAGPAPGWRMVPVKLTDAQYEAAKGAGLTRGTVDYVYEMALAAAPTPPAKEGGQ